MNQIHVIQASKRVHLYDSMLPRDNERLAPALLVLLSPGAGQELPHNMHASVATYLIRAED
jgi:hypothetical protein